MGPREPGHGRDVRCGHAEGTGLAQSRDRRRIRTATWTAPGSRWKRSEGYRRQSRSPGGSGPPSMSAFAYPYGETTFPAKRWVGDLVCHGARDPAGRSMSARAIAASFAQSSWATAPQSRRRAHAALKYAVASKAGCSSSRTMSARRHPGGRIDRPDRGTRRGTPVDMGAVLAAPTWARCSAA